MPFKHAEQTSTADDTSLLSQQRRAGAAVRLFISLGKRFEDSINERAALAVKLEGILKSKDITVDSRVLRSYTVLMFFTIKVQLQTLMIIFHSLCKLC